jgi:hypothetical protein
MDLTFFSIFEGYSARCCGELAGYLPSWFICLGKEMFSH